jgi:SulP family sulfate permease
MIGGGGPSARRREARPAHLGDVIAGVSVALVLIPQSLAYAELAGMPAVRGLYASAIPLLIAAPLASSPYLQTGPVAVTSLLTFAALGSLAEPGSDEYVRLGLLLALMVGLARVALGALRAGVVAYLMSRPMLLGFIPAATILIAASQLPNALGARAPEGDVVDRAVWTLAHPADWELVSVAVSAAVLGAVFGGRRIHPLFPGVLLAVAGAIGLSMATGYSGPIVGHIPSGVPPVSIDLPWDATGSLIVGAVVIALVGFAEPASIARAFATQDRLPWDADRELLSQGAANVAAGLSGGFPVGGSFSRSSLNRLAGARHRLSGAITGATVLAFLPFAFVLEPLPRAVLGAIVIAAVLPLIRLAPVMRLLRFSRPQFLVAAATFVSTLVLEPHVEQGVLIGIGLSVAVHLWRELHLEKRVWREGSTLHLRPEGVLWFGAAQSMQDEFIAHLLEHPDIERLVVHLGAIGRLDVTGALALRAIVDEARRAGVELELSGVHERDRRLIDGVIAVSGDPLEG